MIKRPAVYIAIISTMVLSSCAYSRNRGKDALDVFTLTANVGLGGTAQIGPVKTGLGGGLDMVGISDGCAGACESGHHPSSYRLSAVLYNKQENWSLNDTVPERGKVYVAEGSIVLCPEYKVEKSLFKPYYTQIEAEVNCLYGFRIGLNCGELVDLIAGIFCCDIYNDDICIDVVVGQSMGQGDGIMKSAQQVDSAEASTIAIPPFDPSGSPR